MRNKEIKNIIITDTHTRMALAIIRELGQMGFNITSLSREGLSALGHKSRYANNCITLPNKDYGEALLNLQINDDFTILFPTGMYTLNTIATRHKEFSEAYRGLFPTYEALQKSADKPTVARIARSLGLFVPEEYQLDNPCFPCVLKYRNGEALSLPASSRYAIVHSMEQYKQTLENMQNIASSVASSIVSSANPEEANEINNNTGEVFASQYIPGNAYGVSAVLNKDSEPLAVFAHTRVREYPLTGGPASCAQSIWHLPLINAGLSLLKVLGVVGFAMVEFKGTLEQPYVLEVNPRIWGTYPLSRLCGAGMAIAYVNGAAENASPLPNPLPDQCQYANELRMQFLANDISHFLASIPKGKLHLHVLSDMFSPHVKGGVFDKNDWPGNFVYLKNLFS